MGHLSDPPVLVAVTDDDLASGAAVQWQQLHDFHQRFDIPVSYFLVPFADNGRSSLADDGGMRDMLDTIRADGSEAHPHGYLHHPFEWGFPEIAGAMEFNEGLCRAFADHRFAIEDYQQPAAMRDRLEQVLETWQRFAGVDAQGFRTGWGSFSPTYYQVLEDCGLTWSSVRFASRTSWRWCLEREANEAINPHVGLVPYYQGGVLELPILGDFGFHTTRANQQRMVALFQRQFAACREAQAPCVICHHPHGLASQAEDPNAGFAIYEEIFSWLLVQPGVSFVTMSALARHWGSQARARPPEQFPHTFCL